MRDFYRILRRIIPYKGYIILCFICYLLHALTSLFSLTMLAPFLTVLFHQSAEVMTKPEFSWSSSYIIDLFYYYLYFIIKYKGSHYALIFIAGIMLSFSLLSNLFRYLGLFFMAPVRSNLVRDLRNDIYHKTLILPLAFFSNQRKGDMMNRISTDVLEIEWSVVSMLQMLFREPVMIIIYLAALLIISFKLTVFAVIILILCGILISYIGKLIKNNSTQLQYILSKVSSIFEESISGLRVIKSYNAINHAEEVFKKENGHFYKTGKKMYRIMELGQPLIEFLCVLTVMMILYVGSSFVLGSGGITAEALMLYLVLFARIIPPAKAFTVGFYSINKGMASAKRVFEILDADETITEIPNAVVKTNFTSCIEYSDVSFKYENKYVLKHINLKINKGQTIAIVGLSGAGKSTLVDLLLRFYDCTDGQILIDGYPIKQLNINSLRNLFGMVNQDVVLFNDTIYNNIAFGREQISEDTVVNAAKAAYADEFITQWKDKYQTVIGDSGSKLSGGQRQRISIARAILKNSEILILDEATSALDNESEYLVQSALTALMRNRTTLIIAHRLSTIQNADKIIVLDQGEIVETGTHYELMQQNGIYYKLVQLQQL